MSLQRQSHAKARGLRQLADPGSRQPRATCCQATGSLSGAWYRPELTIEAAAVEQRVVLLGKPGAGKSTVQRYLVVSLAEALLVGRTADGAVGDVSIHWPTRSA
jgi:predicted NACHT family NTPase